MPPLFMSKAAKIKRQKKKKKNGLKQEKIKIKMYIIFFLFF